jgi:AcrR family transcriptional regulator
MAVKTSKSATEGTPKRPRRRRDELILDALEELLAHHPLRDLGVEEIAAAAGITRTRFYHYFKSKYEAYAALLRRILGEVLAVYNLPESWWVRPEKARPRESLAATLRQVLEVWLKHGHVLREASDMWNAVPEVREQWQEVMAGLSDATRHAIERERERGVAPAGPDAQRLAESLIWQGERLLFLTLMDASGAMDLDELVDLGVALWLRSIYLSDDPAPRRRTRDRR